MVAPIQTRYEGCLFRSRLEARWAVFFDALGVKWRYEPEGFSLPSGEWYLPDFYVEGIGYIEIKPDAAYADDKYKELGGMLNEPVFCLAGDIPSPSTIDPCGLHWSITGGLEITRHDDENPDYWFAICPACQKIGLTFQARHSQIECPCPNPLPDRAWNHNIGRILIAVTAARSARF